MRTTNQEANDRNSLLTYRRHHHQIHKIHLLITIRMVFARVQSSK